jgi:16S rRNA (adenine1518-N6/adenine1519-N6)-dimethyltransferase
MQKLGQHFLKNDLVIKKIITALDLRAGDSVIEIGPGHGELTVPLAAACAAVGASLTAIEKDTKLADNLREKFSQEKINATIECGDALKILSSVITKTKNIPHLNLVGNLPYYITGKLLHIISEFEPEQMPERCVFMIQREVAERIIAAPPAMNRLAASVQFWADAEIIVQVPRSDFSPPPKIDSTVIALTTKPVIKSLSSPTSITSTAAHAPLSSSLYYRAVRAIFAQPRKTLLNNIAATSDSQNSTKKISTEALKEEISAQLKKTGINPLARPQDLSIEQIISIATSSLWG